MSTTAQGALFAAVLGGDAERAHQLVERALDDGMLPEEILAAELVSAMDEAGRRFEAREFFLPDLLLAARAMKEVLALLNPLLAKRQVPVVGKVVIGTAAGDLHDIGKNIVAAMLEGGGFAVLDLGYDVKPGEFAQAAREHGADIVAVSALLTSTMPGMKEIVSELERCGLRDRVALLLGGAPVTEEFARKIGAQGYAPNGAAAVRVARQLLAGQVAPRQLVGAEREAEGLGSHFVRDEIVSWSVQHFERRDVLGSPRELVKQALKFTDPERLPRQLWVLPWAEKHYPDAVARLERDFPSDIVSIPQLCSEPVPGQGNAHAVGEFVDAWGCTFHNLQEGIIGEVKQPQIRDWSAAAHVRFPRERLVIDSERVADFCQRTGKYVLAGTCPRPFERLQFLRGSESLYLDMARPPVELYDLLERLHRFYVEELTLWAQTDVDGLVFMDDWGSQHALLISPEQWREMFKPLYAEYVDIGHAHGKDVFMHSDGYIIDIIPDLVEVGLDALNAQVFCMGVEELGKRFGGELTFWGELDRQQVLPYASLDEIWAAARRLRAAFHHEGGFIAQCEFGPGAQPDNVYAFFAACEAS